MTPATSWPGRHPSGLLASKASSPRFKENAWTSTIASSGIGTGSGTSLSSTAIGADGVFTSANISFSFSFGKMISSGSIDNSTLLFVVFLFYRKYRSHSAHFERYFLAQPLVVMCMLFCFFSVLHNASRTQVLL
jgi:hypothetical protein